MDRLGAHDHRRIKRLTDLLDSIRAELRTRLDELRPLVREYERLQGWRPTVRVKARAQLPLVVEC
jgi:hypothetical protein